MLVEFLKKLRPYTLLIAVSLGFLVFCFFTYVEWSAPLKPVAHAAGESLPVILFFILFFAFSKITLHQMMPRAWHFILIVYQIATTAILAFYLKNFPDSCDTVILEGILICLITPTAASASVITGKLGGNESALTTYIILSNLAAAVAIPLLFPLFCDMGNNTFFHDCFLILKHISPILVLPLVLTVLIRTFTPKLHQLIIRKTKDIGFYMWAFIIVVVSAKTFSNIAASDKSTLEITIMAAIGFVMTIMQFALAKGIGQFGHQRISAGQALGQKNMVFGLWVTLTYLTPTVAIIPGTYIIWQNIVNAWQMWYRERNLRRWEKNGEQVYQE